MNYDAQTYQAPSGQWAWVITENGEDIVRGGGYESEADAFEAMQEQLSFYTATEPF